MADGVCAAASRASGEGLHATASIVRNWVLLEQGGPWGPDAVRQSRLPSDVADRLVEQARRHNFRALLLRRTDVPETPGHHCFIAHTSRRQRWIEHAVLPHPSALLDLDFRPLRRGQPVGLGPRWEKPLYLVCTNGRHDTCCAQLGRPVYRALLGQGDNTVWECSHIGGDRFAGNLVCFPHGLYFGRLGPDQARRVVSAYERNTIVLEHFRGRAGDPFAVQAAEYFVRQREGLVGVEDLVATRLALLPNGVADVHFDGPDGRRFEVQVKAGLADRPRLLTCRAEDPQHPVTYSLVDLKAG